MANINELDWPRVPDHLVAEMLKHATHAPDLFPQVVKRAEPIYKSYDAPDSVKQWAKENLPLPDNYTVRVQHILNTTQLPIHIDHDRERIYHYLLTQDPAETVWFTDDLKETETYTMQQFQWYTFDVTIPHRVRNLSTERIALVVYQAVPMKKTLIVLD